jgi:hypothetical protein
LLTGKDTVKASGIVFVGAHVAQQVADDALRAAVQCVGLHVVHQPVQPARDAGQHAHGEACIAPDLVDHGLLADGQHQRIGQGLRVYDVGPAGEHQRFGKALARADDLDHLLLAGL